MQKDSKVKDRKLDAIDLLVRYNNLFLLEGNPKYRDMYRDVLSLLDTDMLDRLPKSPLPMQISRGTLLILIEHHDLHRQAIELIIKERKVIDLASRGDENNRIKNLSWWRRLWKLF